MRKKKNYNKNPILITGPHRSGTTWVGRVMSSAYRTGYIHEPFNINNNQFYLTNNFDSWFLYIFSENEHFYLKNIQDTIRYRLAYPNFSKIKIKYFFKYFIKFVKFKYYQLFRYRPIIKDPIAFFSSDWLATRHDCDVLVLVRHPASFIASIKRKNWSFDFNNFLNQKDLMSILNPFEGEIKNIISENLNVIDQGILLWRIFAYMTIRYQSSHPDWMVIKHEELITDPIGNFKIIFKHFNLDYSSHVDSYLKKTISNNNPREVTKTIDIHRDINSIGKLWTSRLTKDEILKIRTSVSDYYYKFYDDSDWSTM